MLKRFKKWFLEAKAETFQYGCVMLEGRCPGFNKAQSILNHEHVNTFGDTPHITILYGLDPNIPVDDVVNTIKEFNFSGHSLWSKQVDIFTNAGSDDVVKLTIVPDPALNDFRTDLIEKFPNVQSYGEFSPHITLAYVKEGYGGQYVQELPDMIEFIPTRIVYSLTTTQGENIEVSIPIGWE